ncbi:MAG: hypothetical protein GY869_06985 [Planctomycetes bacterium]|nr:hypothetical protein [Planctomycetota bacterium]
MLQNDAKTAITSAGLTLVEIIKAYIDLFPSGHVFLQNPSPG